MTTPQRDGHSATEFSAWFREQREIDSSLGYWNSNLDYVWSIKGEKFCLIEEKRHMKPLESFQRILFSKMDRQLRKDTGSYGGCWLISFENTSPEDGKIFVNLITSKLQLDKKWETTLAKTEREITKEQLMHFLKMNWIYLYSEIGIPSEFNESLFNDAFGEGDNNVN